MSRKLCALATIATAAAVMIAPGPAQARGCHVDQSPRAYGPTYTTSLHVRGVSCADGKGLIRKWDDCRRRNGGADGKCRRPGHHFRCREHRFNVIKTEYDSKVGCRRGGDRVIFTYTQLT